MTESAVPELSQPFETFERVFGIDEAEQGIDELCAYAHLMDAVEFVENVYGEASWKSGL